ncbi:MAG: AAA family ATPase [Acidimicrobiaceae bacterium]|nr:AAA family ATPase [Acidimicrobiaceae bacterium]MYC41143.1 AAA family ATPase [Acidimicrobiaceae bacterium]
MALLGRDDPFPEQLNRVVVAGACGAGKSTVAAAVATELGFPYVELDSLYHGPGWVPRPSFESDVADLAESAQWVTEWQYQLARPVLAARADLLVFLDLPRWLAVSRVVRRTVKRMLLRTELWEGCREPPLRKLFTDRDHIIRWAWRTYPEHEPRVRDLMRQQPALPIVWFKTRRDVKIWLIRLSR